MTGKIGTGEALQPRRARPGIGEFGWIWIATAILFAASLVIAPGTVRVGSLLAMLPFASILAFVAVGQTLVIQQRGLDMSVVALVALGGVMAARIGMDSGSVLLGIVVTLSAAAVLGAVNGFLVARLNIMPIVATLASNAVFLGIVRMVSACVSSRFSRLFILSVNVPWRACSPSKLRTNTIGPRARSAMLFMIRNIAARPTSPSRR